MSHQTVSTRLLESSASELRLAEARAFVEAQSARGDVLIVGASRGAADDLARSIAMRAGATVGLHRLSLTQLAARLAAPVLAAEDRVPSAPLGAEAIAARATFEARREDALQYFEPVASTPGFPRALARTLQEVRLALITPDRLAALPLGGADLATLLDAFEQQFAAAATTDRATLFASAIEGLRSASSPLREAALLLLDVPVDSVAEFNFVTALIGAGSRPVMITVPFGDITALSRFESLGLSPEILEQKGDTDLAALRRYLFSRSQPPEREPRGDVKFFSAPGEGRECVEIGRRILQEARNGVAFDEMAIFVRAPQQYAGLMEHALNRAAVPAYFDRGTRRPHPAGRAFLALLACACEKLSARRFAEYLSLAQVPSLNDVRPVPSIAAPDDEVLREVAREAGEPVDGEDVAAADEPVRVPVEDAEAVIDGSLRAPWKWETLLVESSVIGGEPSRWHRRLDGLANDYAMQLGEEQKDDPESPRSARIRRDLRNLAHLRGFALPVIDRLAAWPAAATWGTWLDLFAELAPVVLRQPDRVLRVLAELRPMNDIGPVPLDEARDVLADRLLSMEVEPPRSRYGRVFVGTPQQARGRVFRVVFVAGLAERLFPQRPHEDPMLLDREMRAPLAGALVVQEDRARQERLLLRLAVGAPTERLWLSYPRIEVAESRPRVPSFYALDVRRAISGKIPRHETLQREAAAEGGAGLTWPGPERPDAAIDDLEHDLAVLKELLTIEPRQSVRGHAHYLLRLNDALKRSVSMRWGRGRSQWTPFDGLTRVTGMTKPLLDAQRLGARPYSLSALQRFAACPYQFLLSAIHRLEPPKEVDPLQKLDPLTRGSIFHEAQAEFFRAMQQEKRLPVAAAGVAHALERMDAVIEAVAERYREKLAPAIDRVWDDEIADIARDLRVWVRRLPEASGAWQPAYFEFAFGLPHSEGRDPNSLADPVVVDGRFTLRGSIDLVERRAVNPASPAERASVRAAGSHVLRITDHKTGKNRTTWKTVVGGGSILQPVLYSLAVERALNVSVESGRLFYCTSAGGFVDHEIPINDANRRLALEALEIIDRAIELGFLPAAPDERACTWCDFRPVCGPDEHERVGRKVREKLGDLEALRKLP